MTQRKHILGQLINNLRKKQEQGRSMSTANTRVSPGKWKSESLPLRAQAMLSPGECNACCSGKVLAVYFGGMIDVTLEG